MKFQLRAKCKMYCEMDSIGLNFAGQPYLIKFRVILNHYSRLIEMRVLNYECSTYYPIMRIWILPFVWLCHCHTPFLYPRAETMKANFH
jgi:hypothetical protein